MIRHVALGVAVGVAVTVAFYAGKSQQPLPAPAPQPAAEVVRVPDIVAAPAAADTRDVDNPTDVLLGLAPPPADLLRPRK